MKDSIRRAVLGGLALVLVAGMAAASGGTWVAADGDVHKLHHGRAMFFSEDGAERFDLAELRDGETRTFGSGERAVTVRRTGNLVTITRSESGDDVSVIDVTCDVEEDNCTVLTFPDDAEKVMIAIEKERVCVDGKGDCDFVAAGVGAGHIVVDIDCEGEDCHEFHGIHGLELDKLHQNVMVESVDGDADGASRIVIRRVGGPGDEDMLVKSMGATVEMLHPHHDKVTLRCTEGDASITVEKEEADDTFLCPKHSTPMERVKTRVRTPVRVIRKGSPHDH